MSMEIRNDYFPNCNKDVIKITIEAFSLVYNVSIDT